MSRMYRESLLYIKETCGTAERLGVNYADDIATSIIEFAEIYACDTETFPARVKEEVYDKISELVKKIQMDCATPIRDALITVLEDKEELEYKIEELEQKIYELNSELDNLKM
jgi:hypothetical protein